jgi:protein-tyrosine phosphatase
VLFLCTGNYYRSRFAELLFSHLARLGGSRWTADSRGLRPSPRNPGPLSPHARLALRRLGVPETAAEARMPMALGAADLGEAGLVVAVKREEHLPLLRRGFPDLVDQVELWEVHDVDVALPSEALPGLERRVRELFARVAAR